MIVLGALLSTVGVSASAWTITLSAMAYALITENWDYLVATFWYYYNGTVKYLTDLYNYYSAAFWAYYDQVTTFLVEFRLIQTDLLNQLGIMGWFPGL